MRIEILRPSDLGPEELRAWQDLIPGIGGINSPFLHPQFSRAVGEQRSAARVALVEGPGGPMAFLPYEYHRAGIARPIGAGLSDYQALVAPSDLDLDLGAVMDSMGVRIWELDHLTAAQQTLLRRVPGRFTAAVSPLMDLGEGFDRYRAAVGSRSLFSDTSRRRHRLESEVGEVALVTRSSDHAALERLLEWKSDQYRRTGRRDRFADPGNRRLLHRLLDVSTPAFSGGLALLTAAATPVAALFYLRSAEVVSYWFPAYDPAFRRYSPGMVLLVDLARELAETGPHLLDLGKGQEPYKDRVANAGYPLLEGYAARSRSALVGWRLYRAPRDLALEWVLASEVRRRRARAALRWAGRLRQSVPSGVAPAKWRKGPAAGG